ncbi:hypothetical protein L2E82_39200 [Cichorium intybus]|uniref:Uncharacterized protein n=1 Tax=Cichorium intybus TaxID=13427 RepID=A0ACB9AHX0_CICIN|nr:hypothetical protein L2E82_39200 [Cichorium intybus]
MAGTAAVKDWAPPLGGGGGLVLPEVMVGGDDGLELGDEVGGQGAPGVVGVAMGGAAAVVGGDAGVVGVTDGGVGVVVGGDAGAVGVPDGGVVVEAETLIANF